MRKRVGVGVAEGHERHGDLVAAGGRDRGAEPVDPCGARRRAPMSIGTHPSLHSTAWPVPIRPLAPRYTGGWGRWRGFGNDQAPSKSYHSPWNEACSSVHSDRRAATASRSAR